MDSSKWPTGGGEIAQLLRDFDWARTPLGPIGQWPEALRMLVDLVLMNPAPSALLWGPEGNLIYNEGYATVCGGKHPACLGASVLDTWPEAREFNGAMLAAGRAGREQVYKNAHFVLTRDGVAASAWFDLYYAPVCATGDGYQGVLATVVEITDRVLAEQATASQARDLQALNAELDSQRARLQAANQRLAGDMDFISNLFQSSPSFMAVLLGPEHRFEMTNAAYDRLIQGRAVRGLPVREALPEIAEQGFIELLDGVYRDGKPFHGQNIEVMLGVDAGGVRERRILDFVYQPLQNEAGKTHGILVEGVDVTARALAEERLLVAQEAGEIGTFEWYPERGELAASETYRRLWGIAPGVTITDEMLLGLVEPDYLHHCGVHRRSHMQNPLEYTEFPFRRADTGELRWMARKGQRVDTDRQQDPRYLGVAYDITDRRQAETRLRELNESLERAVSKEVAERIKAEGALRHAQKMEAVGQLASGVAHDFNNVLQIISSNLQLIDREAKLSGRQGERLAQALTAVARGSRLSLQLLAFGRKQALQPVTTHLGTLLDEVAPLLQRALGDGIVLSLDVAPGLWSVAVDRNQLENAILNMSINARDAMQGKGWLEIGAVNRRAEDGSECVALSLSDNGCGMPAEIAARVFDPFYTTKEVGKGTGLGMSMVYGFVKQSDGNIRIDSTPGMGTTITIELPRVDGAHERGDSASATPLRGGRETILLVDDDPAIRTVTVDMLGGLGYRVLTAANGAQALDMLRGNAGIDLLFSDVSMPGHVSSSELVRQAAFLAPAMAVLLTSGHAVDPSLLDDSMPAGVALLPKPYALSQLGHEIRRRLDERPAASAPRQEQAPRRDDALRFLVVEDDADTRELACEMLAVLGYEVQGMASGEQALARLASTTANVLFTDLNLPGMRGDVLARQACLLKPGLQVVIASGDGRLDLDAAAGAVMLLPKPYDLVQLQQTIAALESAQARRKAGMADGAALADG